LLLLPAINLICFSITKKRIDHRFDQTNSFEISIFIEVFALPILLNLLSEHEDYLCNKNPGRFGTEIVLFGTF
jgi:hypothetical protein